jgi:hypothetical protein
MSLNRISFLEGWERNPAFDRAEDSDSDSYQDLPEGSVASSFPSTYRLNFNPYAGPAWNESPDDRLSFVGSVSPTREGRPGALGSAERTVHEWPAVSRTLGETTGAYEVSVARRIGMCFLFISQCNDC